MARNWRRPEVSHNSGLNAAVMISGSAPAKRHAAAWRGMAAEIVETEKQQRIELRFRGRHHLLVLHAQGTRRAGETFVEGLPASRLRDVERKLTFVPAGHEFFEWQEPRGTASMTLFYLDPARMPKGDRGRAALRPWLFFHNVMLLDTALKLTGLIDGEERHPRYREALGTVLAHELAHLNSQQSEETARGGLAPWQQRIVTDYIEEHLAERISLNTLAGLVNLSPHYFCRAFKHSLGVPPHRYHNSRRIERAKRLLAAHSLTVTEVGFQLGFADTSSFGAAFRKATGLTPTAYHRSVS